MGQFPDDRKLNERKNDEGARIRIIHTLSLIPSHPASAEWSNEAKKMYGE
jgi:hypothetical protein